MIEPWIVNRILSTAGIELQNDDVLSDTTIQVTKILPGNTLLHEDRHLEEISIVSEKVGFIVLNDNPSAVFVHGDTEIPLKRGTLEHHKNFISQLSSSLQRFGKFSSCFY